MMTPSSLITPPELLAPAGDFEKLKAAILFGADAVYCAGESFGMRAASANFSKEELAEAVKYCHERNRKIYITVNIMPRDWEYASLEEFIAFLDSIHVDAVIVADIGVLTLVKRIAPNLVIHLSTQANAVSAAACNAWHELGAKRVVLARELSMKDIQHIRANVPPTLELEAFVHGAMCIAYSGRCLLSNYFVGRDANHGACAQPCRWGYHSCENDTLELSIAEEKRPDQLFPLQEENGETFVMSSKDTCMIEHVPELIMNGVSSFKIEGRVKSAYYAAVTTNTYRMAIDAYMDHPDEYQYQPEWMNELCSVSHREYHTGFYFDSPHENANTVTQMGYIREKAYIATAISDSDAEGKALFIQRNKLSVMDAVELLSPGKIGQPFVAQEIRNEKGQVVESAPHPGMIFQIHVPFTVHTGDILRLAKNE